MESKITKKQRRLARWQREHPHIVDELIRERAHTLSQSRLWPLYRLSLNNLLGYGRAVAMADHVRDLSGADVFHHVSTELDLTVNVQGMEHIPASGTFILAINHPTGLADGVAVFDALKQKRPDMMFFANSDALRVAKRMDEIIIPVEWVEAKRTRARSKETLVSMTKAFKQERAIVLFPSGRLAFMDENKVLTEQTWQQTVAALPKKYDCPIIPAYLTGRNSWLYYWFRNLNSELRDMTLFHELLNKKGKEFDLMIGDPIDWRTLPEDAEKGAEMMRIYVTTQMPDGVSWAEFLTQQTR